METPAGLDGFRLAAALLLAAAVPAGAAVGIPEARLQPAVYVENIPTPEIDRHNARANDLYQACKPAVVKVKTSGGLGSGFFIAAGGLILTNAHVVGREREVEVSGWRADGGKWKGRARLTDIDQEWDLALLQVEESDRPGPWPLLGFAAAPEKVGDIVFMIGHPLGLGSGPTPARVNKLADPDAAAGDIDESHIELRGHSMHGNSGGPVVDMGGAVIGMESNGSEGEHLGYAIPRSELTRFLRGAAARGGAASPAQPPARAIGRELALVAEAGRPAVAAVLRGGRQAGSAFFFDDRGYLLTASETLGGAGRVALEGRRGDGTPWSGEAEVVHVDARWKVAVLRAGAPDAGEWTALRLAEPPATPRESDELIGHLVMLIGGGRRAGGRPRPGREGTIRRMPQPGADPARPGESHVQVVVETGEAYLGGPVVDADGRALGLASIDIIDEKISGMALAVPAAALAEIVRAAGLP